MNFSFTEEEHQILQSLFECDGESCYELAWPAGWIGGLKFKMISRWGEAGATLYHKLRDGLEEVLASDKGSSRALQEQRVTLKQCDGESYVIEKTERKKIHHLSEHRFDWSQLAMEARGQRRTVVPPIHHLYIKRHSRFEAEKLATVTSSRSRAYTANMEAKKSKVTSLNKEVLCEMTRMVAFLAEREEKETVDYITLDDDMLRPMAEKSALQEIGRDMYSYIERKVQKIMNEKKQSSQHTMSS